jgi:hypothetical protein
MVRIQLVLIGADMTRSLKPLESVLCLGTLTRKVTIQIRIIRSSVNKNRILFLNISTNINRYAAVNISKTMGIAMTLQV